jgi:hypothetical protein
VAAVQMHVGRVHRKNIVRGSAPAHTHSVATNGHGQIKRWEPQEIDAVKKIAAQFGSDNRVAWSKAKQLRPDLFEPLKRRSIPKIHSFWNSLNARTQSKVNKAGKANEQSEQETAYEATLDSLNHCPRCGFNLKALILALPVALKYSPKV